MLTIQDEVVQFAWVGQLIDRVFEEGYKIKSLRVMVSEREYWIKLSKNIRKTLDPNLVPGCWVEVSGCRKICKKTGKLKLKADFVQRVAAPPSSDAMVCVARELRAKPVKASILMCQKSDCMKRGGREICQAIARYLRDRGLEESVQIKATGCLKQCKKGPNLIVMPDKARYSQIASQEIPELLEKHFATAASR
jgi:(2Fe-2S) ferredoxin